MTRASETGLVWVKDTRVPGPIGFPDGVLGAQLDTGEYAVPPTRIPGNTNSIPGNVGERRGIPGNVPSRIGYRGILD